MNVFQSLGSTLTDGYSPAVGPNASRTEEQYLYREYGWSEVVFNNYRESI